MSLKQKWTPRNYAIRLPLLLTIAVSTTGCENAREAVQQVAGNGTPSATVVATSRPRQEIPKEILACLKKKACVDSSGQVKKECDKTKGIVTAYVNSEAEKEICARTLERWDKEQARIAADETAAAAGHPRSGSSAKPARVAPKADWP